MKEYVKIVHGSQTSFHKNTFWWKRDMPNPYTLKYWKRLK
jgi:hypothetical protein